MKYAEARERCYELVDINRGYVEQTRKIYRYERSPLCTNFINAVQRYVSDAIYPFVSQLSNKIARGEPEDTEWARCNVQRFEEKTKAHSATLEMLKTLPPW